METEVGILLVAKDMASGTLNRVRGELGALGAAGSLAAGGLGRVHGAASAVGGALSHAKNQISGLLGSVGLLAGGAGIVGLVGGFKAATDAAMSFQQAMELIRTQAGASQAEVDAMSKALVAMAPQVGIGPEELAAGLYHVESAGIRGAQALDVLRTAAEGAKVGGADLESVTNALIASVTSGIKGVSDMTSAMGVLNAVVGSGNMRMQDLTDAFGTGILSTAKTFGLSIQSVGAAIADMTNQGVPAIDAATRLRMTISLMGAPTSKAAKELKSIGIGQLDLANAMRGPGGIVSAVDLLREHMIKAHLIDASGNVTSAGADLLSQAFGGGRSSSAIMTLLGSADKFAKIQQQVTAGAGSFGDAWAATEETAAAKMDKFRASLQVLAVDLGNVLLPVATQAASALSDWVTQNQTGIVNTLQGAVGAAKEFGAGLKDWVLPALQAVAGIIGAIPGPIKELAAGGFLLNKGFGWLFGTSLVGVGKNVLGSLLGHLPGPLGAVGGAIAGVPHVWVDNMPAGGLGGGLGSAAPGLGGAAAGIGAGTLAAGAGLTIAAAAAVGATYYLQRQGLSAQSDAITRAISAQTQNAQTSNQQLARDLLAVQAGQHQLNSNLFTQLGGLIFGTNSSFDRNIAALRDALTARGIKLDDATLRSLAQGTAPGATANAMQSQQTRGYSNVVALLETFTKRGGLNANAVLPALQALNEVFRTSSGASAHSVANAIRVESELQQQAMREGNRSLAAEIGRERDSLYGVLTQMNGTLVSLPGAVSSAIAGIGAYLSSAAFQSYRAGERASLTIDTRTNSPRENNQGKVFWQRGGGGRAVRID